MAKAAKIAPYKKEIRERAGASLRPLGSRYLALGTKKGRPENRTPFCVSLWKTREGLLQRVVADRDRLLAVLLGDRAFDRGFLAALADFLVQSLGLVVAFGEIGFRLAVGGLYDHGSLAFFSDTEIAFGAGGRAFEFGGVSREGRKGHGENCAEECDFFHLDGVDERPPANTGCLGNTSQNSGCSLEETGEFARETLRVGVGLGRGNTLQTALNRHMKIFPKKGLPEKRW